MTTTDLTAPDCDSPTTKAKTRHAVSDRSSRTARSTIVAFSGIEGFIPHSMRRVADSILDELTQRGHRIENCRFEGKSCWWRILKNCLPGTLVLFVVRYLVYPLLGFRCWRQHGPDAVYYIPDHANAAIALALPRQARVVMHVHDLAGLIPAAELPYRRNVTEVISRIMSCMVKRRAIHRADAIVTVSAAMKTELGQRLGVSADRVHVVYNGIDPIFRRPRSRQASRQKLELAQDRYYVLAIAAPTRRKNVEGVLSAFVRLAERDENIELLLVGVPNRRILRRIARLACRNRIRRFTNVDDEMLAQLYSAADVFVFPSFYEGFGLPAVEAMACRCPVIVSDTPALQEIAGTAAEVIPTESPLYLASTIATLRDDQEWEDRLRRSGFQHATRFSWTDSAQRIEQLLLEIARTTNQDTDELDELGS